MLPGVTLGWGWEMGRFVLSRINCDPQTLSSWWGSEVRLEKATSKPCSPTERSSTPFTSRATPSPDPHS